MSKKEENKLASQAVDENQKVSAMSATDTETSEVVGFGAKVQYADVGGTIWTTIAGLTEVTPPSATSTVIDTTSHDNPTPDKTNRAGLTEPGTFDLTAHYDATQFTALLALRRIKKDWRVIASNNTGAACRGWLNEVTGPEIDIDGLATMTLSIQASGPITAVTVA